MRVAIVNTHYYPHEFGGAERSVRILAERLALEHEVMVVCLGKSPADEVVNGVRVVRVPLRNKYDPWTGLTPPNKAHRLRWHVIDVWNSTASVDVDNAFNDFQPDIVHTNNLQGFSVKVWSAAARRTIPVLHTIRDYYLLCPATTMSKGDLPCRGRCLECRVLSAPKQLASHLVARVVGISQFVLQAHLAKGYFRNADSQVVYNAYEVAVAPPRVANNERPIQIGFLGRLTRAKGAEAFIAAAKLVFNKRQGVEFVIGGEAEDDSYMRHLKGLVANSPFIRFLGKVQTADFFNSIDMLVVPSLWAEPLGRVVLEAIVHRVPVVATPVGGIPELLEDGGGLLATGTDVAAIAAAVLQKLADHRLELGNAPDYAALSKKFSVDLMAQQYLAVYRSMVGLNEALA